MSLLHPIIGVTGSSGAGTSTARGVLEAIFRELSLNAAYVEGDAFHAYDRAGTRQAIERARIRGEHFSLLGPGGNLLERLQGLLMEYGMSGSGLIRRYLHTEEEANCYRQWVGTFTPWEPLPAETDMLLYEGLHGGYVGKEADIASHMDLLIGVVPIVNLEWIQKIRRDTDERGHRPEDVTATILRRMPDYINHIAPQFSRTDVNFQRVPLVDTSNPFALQEIPSQCESLVVVHFNTGSRIRHDLAALEARIPGAARSNAHTLVVPGPQMGEAMRLIVRPQIELMARNRIIALQDLTCPEPP